LSLQNQKIAGRNRLFCWSQAKALEIAVFPRFLRDADAESETNETLKRQEGISEKDQNTQKKGSGTSFFFLLLQLVVFTKTNAQSAQTSPSSFSSKTDPCLRTISEFSTPKPRKTGEKTTFLSSSGSSQQPLEASKH